MLAVGLRARQETASVPRLQIHAVTQHRQAGQAASQIEQAGTLTAGSVQRQHFMLQPAQDRAHQPGQTGTRSDFQEGADARAEQVLDLGHPLDRPRQLAGQEVAGLAGIGRVRRRRGVGVDGGGGTHLGRFQSRPEGRLGGGDLGAVERRRHGQACRPHLPRLERGRRPVHVHGQPGQHRLLGRVLVRQYQIVFLFRQDLSDRFGGGVDGEHSTGFASRRGRHQSAALPRQNVQVFGTNPSGGGIARPAPHSCGRQRRRRGRRTTPARATLPGSRPLAPAARFRSRAAPPRWRPAPPA